jgi:hypothetical protein
MAKYCDIVINVRAEGNNGGGTYVKDLPLEEANTKLKEIESIMRDFSIANDGNMAFVDTDEYGSFIAVDTLELSCIQVSVDNIRENGPKSLRESVEEIMQRVLYIDNPTSLLEKTNDKEIEHSMEDEDWAYGHNHVSDYHSLTQKKFEERPADWYEYQVEAMEKDMQNHPKKYKGGCMKW